MKKANHQTNRSEIDHLQQIMNIGPSIADDLNRIGIRRPQQLCRRDPWRLFLKLCQNDGIKYDPCVLDVFISAVDFMDGNRPQPWWNYTARRKREFGVRISSL